MSPVLNTKFGNTIIPTHYHTSNSHKCLGVDGEALQLHAVYKKYYKSHENPYQVLQVTCAASE